MGAPLGGEDFCFDGADFWSRRGLDPNGDCYFVLYHDGVRVYNRLNDNDGRQRFTGDHQLFVPNYTGVVDGFAMACDSGLDDRDHLAMDNVCICAVPTPGTVAVILAVAAPTLLRRRRRHAAI